LTHATSDAWTASTTKKYRETWRVLSRHLQGGPAAGDLAVLDTEAGAAALLAAYRAAWSRFGPATRVRHLSTMRSAIGWWRECGWLASDPTRGEPMPTIVVDATKALSRGQVDALFKLDVPLREKVLRRMAYETTCRSDELLCLDLADLDLPNKRAAVRQKGNTIKWIHWQSETAYLLPRLIAGRTSGPLFLADRLNTGRSPTPTAARPPAAPGCPIAAPRSCSPSSP
jgi:integrase/recombinase XerD